MTSTRVGAIDCGTNSIRLLIADVDSERGLVDVDRRMEIVRLGQDVDRTGELGAAALERTFVACETYADVLRVNDVRRLRFVATSASRDARNRDIFVAGVRDRLGVEPEVISGTEEAALAFAGATWELSAGVDSRLVVDIGGGSTEFVLGTDRPTASCSVDIGCVRITERHLHSDPPTVAEVAAATSDIDAALDVVTAQVPVGDAGSLVGLAGSVTTVAALSLGLTVYDAARIHRSVISADEVRRLSDGLLAMTRAERAALAVMHPGRVDVIAAGALVLRRILDRTGLPQVTVSEHDILDGIALSLVHLSD
jgi:exopolyphosphatase/guanosine-5'-triphosphate,3'-diphosphate pyrophosphatase